ncbi:MAG: hypothetical protein C4583_15545 [Anaerolineaceae bacterium]|nr:MAG: hypothetical protein C4583_15545 [Anaerolineaceae bacterium]
MTIEMDDEVFFRVIPHLIVFSKSLDKLADLERECREFANDANRSEKFVEFAHACTTRKCR